MKEYLTVLAIAATASLIFLISSFGGNANRKTSFMVGTFWTSFSLALIVQSMKNDTK